MEKPTICHTCLEEGFSQPAILEMGGLGFCRKHSTAVHGAERALGIAARKLGTEIDHQPDPVDCSSLMGMLGATLRGVLDGKVNPQQANAVSGLSLVMLKTVELEWKMNRAKDVSYVIHQLEKADAKSA